MDWTVVIASAATAALVSSVFQLLGGWAERRARRQELLIKLSIEAARDRESQLKFVRETSGKGVLIRDPVYSAASYYPQIKRLVEKGSLSKEDLAREAESIAQFTDKKIT